MDENTKSKLVTLTDAVSGLAASPKRMAVKALATATREAIQGNVLAGFGKAYQMLVDEGRIKPDYLNTPRGRATFQQFVFAIDSEEVNESRLEAIEAIFISAAQADEEKDDTVLVVSLMRIANQLSAGQLAVLAASWNFNKQYPNPAVLEDGTLWQNTMVQVTGLTPELIESDVKDMTDLHLYSGSNTNGVYSMSLTGQKLCEYWLRNQPGQGE